MTTGILQTILFPSKKFSRVSAVEWLVNHGYVAHKVDKTANFLRFRQREPMAFGSYYTTTLPNGVEMVYEKAP
jgi:hypothetical protein